MRLPCTGAVFFESCHGGALAKGLTPEEIGDKRIFAFSGAKYSIPIGLHDRIELMKRVILETPNEDEAVYEPFLDFSGTLVWFEDGQWHKLSSIQYSDEKGFYRKYKTLDTTSTPRKWIQQGENISLEELPFTKDPDWLGSVLLITASKKLETDTKKAQRLSTVRALINCGANIEFKTTIGTNALLLAAKANDSGVVHELLKAGANPRNIDSRFLQTNVTRRNDAEYYIERAIRAWQKQENAVNTIKNCLYQLGVTIENISSDVMPGISGEQPLKDFHLKIDINNIRKVVAGFVYGDDLVGNKNQLAGDLVEQLAHYTKCENGLSLSSDDDAKEAFSEKVKQSLIDSPRDFYQNINVARTFMDRTNFRSSI